MSMSEADVAALQANLTRNAAQTPKRKRKPAAPPVPSETVEHRALARYLDADPRFADRWFHPANGESRDPRDGAKLKAMGVKPGVPDVWILAPVLVNGVWHPGVVLELKRQRGGRTSPAQEHWLDVARAAGFIVFVAHGASEAIDRLREIYHAVPA